MASIPPADYLIVGGGTAGLVLAARLSEDPEANVVVLESGPDRTSDPRIQNPLGFMALAGSDLDWKPQVVPQLLGGSSAINSLLLAAPSPAGINAWAKFGNPDWTWEAFKPYLQKAFGSSGNNDNGMIKTIQPALVEGKPNALVQAWNDAHAEQGYGETTNFLSEEKTVGARPFTATIDPVSGNRSSADSTYGAVAATRPNVTIVTEATVRNILLAKEGDSVTATGVEVAWNGSVTTVEVRREVILAAGVFHTPKLLELSGIGDKERLQSFNIPVLLHSPGVGENLQNHVMAVIPVPLKDTPTLSTIQPGIEAVSFTRLDLADLLTEDTRAQSSCTPDKFALVVVMLCYPFSRGTVHITSSDPSVPPTVDLGVFSNPIDIEILARHVQGTQTLLGSTAFEQFVLSPPEVQDIETIKTQLHESMASAAHHACGTAAMLPRQDGGVVGQDLKVHGTRNLRIVDASCFPLISCANPMGAVYGVAERAADVIKGVV
ncbi:hypothetical protein BDV11DRAFT_201817 [Aspergillus similis]